MRSESRYWLHSAGPGARNQDHLGAVCSCCCCCSTNCCKITSRPPPRAVANVNDICSWTGREVLAVTPLAPPRAAPPPSIRPAKDPPRLMVKSLRPARPQSDRLPHFATSRGVFPVRERGSRRGTPADVGAKGRIVDARSKAKYALFIPSFVSCIQGSRTQMCFSWRIRKAWRANTRQEHGPGTRDTYSK